MLFEFKLFGHRVVVKDWLSLIGMISLCLLICLFFFVLVVVPGAFILFSMIACIFLMIKFIMENALID